MIEFKHSPTTPLPSLAHRVADALDWAETLPVLRIRRTCAHCGTEYKGGGDAGKCEQWHEGLLG